MRQDAPSIFAEGKHASRSERHTYIPTIDVLRGLHREGFEPFMVAQGCSRIEGKTEYTKHMIRMRHHRDIGAQARTNWKPTRSSYYLASDLHVWHRRVLANSAA